MIYTIIINFCRVLNFGGYPFGGGPPGARDRFFSLPGDQGVVGRVEEVESEDEEISTGEKPRARKQPQVIASVALVTWRNPEEFFFLILYLYDNLLYTPGSSSLKTF